MEFRGAVKRLTEGMGGTGIHYRQSVPLAPRVMYYLWITLISVWCMFAEQSKSPWVGAERQNSCRKPGSWSRPHKRWPPPFLSLQPEKTKCEADVSGQRRWVLRSSWDSLQPAGRGADKSASHSSAQMKAVKLTSENAAQPGVGRLFLRGALLWH